MPTSVFGGRLLAWLCFAAGLYWRNIPLLLTGAGGMAACRFGDAAATRYVVAVSLFFLLHLILALWIPEATTWFDPDGESLWLEAVVAFAGLATCKFAGWTGHIKGGRG
ncbi:MAG: hypothetical protein IRY98_01890 [Alicyclobacillaceae bacterium]|nr:hypothetical protein [Alicyclobacillaceae bacterium]